MELPLENYKEIVNKLRIKVNHAQKLDVENELKLHQILEEFHSIQYQTIKLQCGERDNLLKVEKSRQVNTTIEQQNLKYERLFAVLEQPDKDVITVEAVQTKLDNVVLQQELVSTAISDIQNRIIEELEKKTIEEKEHELAMTDNIWEQEAAAKFFADTSEWLTKTRI